MSDIRDAAVNKRDKIPLSHVMSLMRVGTNNSDGGNSSCGAH